MQRFEPSSPIRQRADELYDLSLKEKNIITIYDAFTI